MRLSLRTQLAWAIWLLLFGAGALAQEFPYDSPTLLPLPQIDVGSNLDFRTYGAPATQDARPFAQSAPASAPYSWGGHAPRPAYPEANPTATRAAPARLLALPSTESWGSTREAYAADFAGKQTSKSVSVGVTGGYDEALTTPWGNDCLTCAPVSRACTWFGGVYGLVMTRDGTNPVHKQLSFDDTNPAGQLMSTSDASMNYQGGVEVRLGRTMASGHYAWEVVYWGIFTSTEEANAFDPAGAAVLRSALDFADLQADGEPGGLGSSTFVNNFYDNGQRHRLRRSFEFHNIELNFMRMPLDGWLVDGGRWGRVQVRGALGVRYFRFDEDFMFDGDAVDTTFGSNNDEMFYTINVENNLVGFQLGYLADYQWSRRFSLYADTKFGLYGNHMRHRSLIANANGVAVVGPAALANVGREFNIGSHKNDVSFVGELRLGASYQFSPHWRGTIGYRAVAVTGVALAANQIPANFDDIAGVEEIESNGSLILHGFQAGLELNY